jgi:hypothetical protein
MRIRTADFWWMALAAGLLAQVCLAAEPDSAPSRPLPPAAERQVDFIRDIQPIFAERCNHCHGEDDQQGQLRLDAKALVMRGGKSGPLFAAGRSDESLLIRRLVGLGTEKQMPLEDDPLTSEQVALIRAWIDQGAKWPDGVGSSATEIKKHWAYVAPVSPPLPAVRDSSWPVNALDRFVLARLEKESIAPSAPVSRERLIRRASLDLVGVPPSVAEVDAFVADKAPDAYERLIDRLLASPRYGERWATPWLDAARYADSNGYQRDGHRTIWPYRDWIIQALNADKPFDQFTIEQIAGDLLPDSTIEQQIATGFHRCTTVNVEAGTDEEENRTNQVIDRVNVTGTVWLGTTLECCQCHDHKFDPFTQRDYYQFFAFFNNSPKETYQRTKGAAALDFGGPEVKLPADPKIEKQRQEIAAQKEELEAEIEQCVNDEKTGLAAWLRDMEDADKAEKAKLPVNIRRFLAVEEGKRNKNQRNALRNYFVGLHPEAKKTKAEMDKLQLELDALAPPVSLVMTEMSEPRMTTIFQRGDFLSPGEKVEPAAPAILPKLNADRPRDRLGLAQWLVSSENPLTPRVQVNRAWAQFFGRGIVASEEDLGTQSEPPTHPGLLDWLACELRDGGWSRKQTHRRIVESATYRQSSDFRSDLAERDPNNLLLARAPRFRLTAEMIRDNALAVSGQLVNKMHGPQVYPLQPDGVWRVTGSVDNTYRTSQGADAWRRGVYTVWRRSAPYPSFLTFDAPDRSACAVKRPRSNSPLQALTLQNDPVYVEAAEALADQILKGTSGAAPDDRLRFAFRTVLARDPDDAELSQLREILKDARARYSGDAKAARAIAGNRELPAGVRAPGWAAWFNVAHVLLNLDETITKP